MRPTKLLKYIGDRYMANIKRSVHVESSPGLGKTQIAAQAATQLNIGFRAIHAPLMQPEDYGMPVISANRDDVNFVVSKAKFPIIGADCPNDGILLIDELPQADIAGQKILANLLQEREIHGQALKPGWMIVTTGNRAVDRAGANKLLTHLKNKITTVELEASLDDWKLWALDNGVATEVIAFLNFRPELLNAFDPHQEMNPTPRAWAEGVAKQLGVIDSDLEFEGFRGDVGEGAAAEFCAFLKIWRKLPNPDAILMNPKGADVPSDPATLYALCGALASKTSPDNFGRIMEYVGRMPPEFGVLFVRDAIRKNPSICNTKDYIRWASTDGAKILV